MHRLHPFSLLLLCAIESASLVLSNTPRPNPTNQGTPQLIGPANLIPPQNRPGPPPPGTYHDINPNLTIYITLDDTAPAQPGYEELLRLAKEQTQDGAAFFGPTSVVPRRKKHPELTQVIHAGLTYLLDPAPAFVRGRPPLEWGEFAAATSWLYEHSKLFSKHRQCGFVLFRKMGATTANEVNLGWGEITGLNTTEAVDYTA